MKAKHIMMTLVLSLTLAGCQINSQSSNTDSTNSVGDSSSSSSDSSSSISDSSSSVDTFTITWNNYDGTTLEVDEGVAYGSTPSYDGATPTMSGDAQYSYIFSGWSPTITSVTSNATYTAQFTSSTNAYTITWKNYDGTTLEVDSGVTYGATPTYDGAIPTKSGDAQYSYIFSGWSPTITSVTSNTTYTAQFTSSTNAYTITWKNYDGTTLEVDSGVTYGATPTYDGAIPTKSGDARYSYAFSGWSPEVTSVTSNTTYTAQFTSSTNAYTITWKNYDGTTLEVDSGVTYGATPTYDGAIPTKSGDAQYSYAFSGWSPEVSLVMGNATYTAEFSSSTNNYTITWKNYDDTILEVDEGVAYGSMPTYDGEIPEKSEVEIYAYIFSGWSPMIRAVTESTTYIAQFFEKEKDSRSNLYYTEYDDYIVINNVKNILISEIIIPTVINGKPITSIDKGIFVSCPNLTNIIVNENNLYYSSVEGVLFNKNKTALIAFPRGKSGEYVIPDSVNLIDNYAFSGCRKLTDIVIPNGVMSIGYSTFSGCCFFEITIPNSVTLIDSFAFSYSDVMSVIFLDCISPIGDYAFFECTNLANVSFGNSISSIGSHAFYGCTKLTNLIIPNYTTQIGEYAFFECTNLINFSFGNGTTQIGEYAFSKCTSLTSFVLPSSIILITGTTFELCSNLINIIVNENNLYYSSVEGVLFNKNKTALIAFPGGKSGEYVIPDSVMSIGYNAFSGCKNITNIVIPNSVAEIGGAAFKLCSSLTSLILPDSVTYTGGSLFTGCTNLTNIVIPNSENSVDGITFYGCSNLTNIIVNENNLYYSSVEGVLFNKNKTALIAFPAGISGEYAIPNSVMHIGMDAFCKCANLVSVVIPNSVISMAPYAFNSCVLLTIYVEADSKPSGWSNGWNPSNCPVIWGYKG